MFRTTARALVIAAAFGSVGSLAGCSTAPTSAQGKEHILEDAAAALKQAKKSDETLAKLL